MPKSLRRPIRLAALSAGLVAMTACATSRSASSAGAPFQMGDAGALVRARADSVRYPWVQADVDFMSGMIHHHAQAITISRWAPSHGASASVQRLTARIINAQTDEITIMQTWLKDRRQAVPMVDSIGNVTMGGAGHDMAAMAGHDMGGMAMGQMSMPGMLTDAQLKELNTARGTEFDRLFLTYMIQHHRGAVAMVKTLFSAQGAGQDETVFKFANDVEVDQSTEIKRMFTMMLEMGFAPPA
ncbi:DUF305 domain-containing protein [Gemmatimonas sp.]|jgi:uncharacterized protein (DUF305 family)|uniref:DUF305 domain-containing protein n=1 Tax=Gemmatimonas sp. TaxID=1962908 RepID=UPI0037BEA9C5